MSDFTKVDRARMLRRCRKPALSSMEYGSITSELDRLIAALPARCWVE